ncbi:MAG: PPC domain-containing protein, partial [Phycisphaerae bacterium]|nr:PPC domain-containing protein [Phycisphaerae bacterium]
MPTRDRCPWPRYRTDRELPVSFEQLEPRLLLNGTLPAFAPLDPYGSLIYWTQAADEIETIGDADDHTFVIEGAQTATVLIYPDSTLRAEVKIVHGLSQVGIAQGSEAGENVVLSGVALDEAGTYKIVLTGLEETVGTYMIDVCLGAVIDSEVYEGGPNSTFATAQDIDGSFLSLDGEARRGAVLGSLSVVSDDFETGLLDTGTWGIPISPGRTEVTDAHTAAGGDYSLWMDLLGGGADALNEAIWTVDLSGLTEAYLHFSHAEYNDDEHAFGGPFVGQHNADGVAISADGITWYPVWDATDQTEAEWQEYTIDLAAKAAAAGITLGADFKIKFQQYDDGEIPSAGRGWDDVNITRYGAPDSEDWYVFSPPEAGEITLALVSPYTDDVEMELYSAGEELLAQSSFVGTNVTQVLTDFTVVPEDYYIRVTGHDAYNLVVLTKSTFDIMPNNEPALAQNISAAPTVLGAIYGGESHFYRFWMNDAGDISIKTLTPMGDSLDPAIVLYDETWTPLADDDNSAADGRNASLTFAGPGPGTYFVELYSAGGTGEFVLDVGHTSNLPPFVPVS